MVKIALSGEIDHRDTGEFTMIGYAQPKTRPWSGLCGDVAVQFQEQSDGSIRIVVQTKHAGPDQKARIILETTVYPWEE